MAASTGGGGLEEFELPKTVVLRIFKSKVPDSVILSKDGRNALAAAATVFINYLAATANDLATVKGAKTLTSQAVLQALDELGFEGFSGPVRTAVDTHKQTVQEKRQASSEKRKAKDVSATAETTEDGAAGAAPEAGERPTAKRPKADADDGNEAEDDEDANDEEEAEDDDEAEDEEEEDAEEEPDDAADDDGAANNVIETDA